MQCSSNNTSILAKLDHLVKVLIIILIFISIMTHIHFHYEYDYDKETNNTLYNFVPKIRRSSHNTYILEKVDHLAKFTHIIVASWKQCYAWSSVIENIICDISWRAKWIIILSIYYCGRIFLSDKGSKFLRPSYLQESKI